MTTKLRTCNICKESKPVTEFPLHFGSPKRYCKSCHKANSKVWCEKNPEKVKESNKKHRSINREEYLAEKKAWCKANPDRVKANNLRNRFWPNLTTEEVIVVYKQMIDDQKECCKICGKHQSQLKKKLHVDHCHRTGVVRGLLCSPCNIGLGAFEDNVSSLEKAAKYIQESEKLIKEETV